MRAQDKPAPRRNLNHFSPRSRFRSSSMIFSSIAGVSLAASGFRTNQGIETSHANPNRLNQWYQTAWFPCTFEGGPQDSRRQPEKRTRATLKITIWLSHGNVYSARPISSLRNISVPISLLLAISISPITVGNFSHFCSRYPCFIR